MHLALKIIICRPITMTCSWNDQHFKALSSLNQSLRHPVSMRWIHINIHISGYKHQMSFQILSYLCIGPYSELIFVLLLFVSQTVFHHLYHFFYSIITFSPTTVINRIIMITRAGNSRLIKIRISKNGCGSHKPSTGMPVNAYSADINK